jgi:hypothetical protein
MHHLHTSQSANLVAARPGSIARFSCVWRGQVREVWTTRHDAHALHDPAYNSYANSATRNCLYCSSSDLYLNIISNPHSKPSYSEKTVSALQMDHSMMDHSAMGHSDMAGNMDMGRCQMSVRHSICPPSASCRANMVNNCRCSSRGTPRTSVSSSTGGTSQGP